MGIATQEEYWEAHVNALNRLAAAMERKASVEEARWQESQNATAPEIPVEEVRRQERLAAITDAELAARERKLHSGMDEMADALNLGYHINDVANHVFDGTILISEVPSEYRSRVQGLVDKRKGNT